MQSFEVRQHLLGLEAFYEVRREGDEEHLMTIRGTEAIMKLLSPDEETVMASFRMRSILSETKFEVFDGEDRTIAFFEFPVVELKKHFSLKLDGRVYAGEGGLRGKTFRFRDGEGEVVLEIVKHSSFRDVYTVNVADAIPVNVALLAAAVVDQKHFERRG